MMIPSEYVEGDRRDLSGRIRDLEDRLDIRELCDRYVINLDRYQDDGHWYDSVFTEDVWLRFPLGEYNGFSGLDEFHRQGRSRFETTHHMSTNLEISLRGDDTAAVRAHLVARHVRKASDPTEHFDIGGYYDAEVVRTDRGWRFRRFDFSLVWIAGGAEVPEEITPR